MLFPSAVPSSQVRSTRRTRPLASASTPLSDASCFFSFLFPLFFVVWFSLLAGALTLLSSGRYPFALLLRAPVRSACSLSACLLLVSRRRRWCWRRGFHRLCRKFLEIQDRREDPGRKEATRHDAASLRTPLGKLHTHAPFFLLTPSSRSETSLSLSLSRFSLSFARAYAEEWTDWRAPSAREGGQEGGSESPWASGAGEAPSAPPSFPRFLRPLCPLTLLLPVRPSSPRLCRFMSCYPMLVQRNATKLGELARRGARKKAAAVRRNTAESKAFAECGEKKERK